MTNFKDQIAQESSSSSGNTDSEWDQNASQSPESSLHKLDLKIESLRTEFQECNNQILRRLAQLEKSALEKDNSEIHYMHDKHRLDIDELNIIADTKVTVIKEAPEKEKLYLRGEFNIPPNLKIINLKNDNYHLWKIGVKLVQDFLGLSHETIDLHSKDIKDPIVKRNYSIFRYLILKSLPGVQGEMYASYDQTIGKLLDEIKDSIICESSKVIVHQLVTARLRMNMDREDIFQFSNQCKATIKKLESIKKTQCSKQELLFYLYGWVSDEAKLVKIYTNYTISKEYEDWNFEELCDEISEQILLSSTTTTPTKSNHNNLEVKKGRHTNSKKFQTNRKKHRKKFKTSRKTHKRN